MNNIDIKGKELYIIERILNRQQSRDIKNHFTIDDVNNLISRDGYPSELLTKLESKGLVCYADGYVYITDLAKVSLENKRRRESAIINEHIIDDYEYAFLLFMHNRNEPVPMFHFPYEFQNYSKIHMQPVEGHTNLFYDWMDEIQKYIDDPTIDGYILNEAGKARFEKLKKEKELKTERENLEMQKLRGEVRSLTNVLADYDTTKCRAKWGFIISIITVLIAALAILISLMKHKS